MTLLSFSAPIQGRAAASLQRRFITTAAAIGISAVLALAAVAAALLSRNVRQLGDTRVADAATRAEIVVREELMARAREARSLAMGPEVIAAAREGAQKAAALRLPGTEIK